MPIITYSKYLDEIDLHAALEHVLLVAVPVLKEGLVHGVVSVTLFLGANLKLDLFVIGARGAVYHMVGIGSHRILAVSWAEVDASAVDVDAEVAFQYAEELGLVYVKVGWWLLAPCNQFRVNAEPRPHEAMEGKLAIGRARARSHRYRAIEPVRAVSRPGWCTRCVENASYWAGRSDIACQGLIGRKVVSYLVRGSSPAVKVCGRAGAMAGRTDGVKLSGAICKRCK
jgi:hypothetical protein